MARDHGPKIPKDGLLVYYDSTIDKTYSSGNVELLDLVKKHNLDLNSINSFSTGSNFFSLNGTDQYFSVKNLSLTTDSMTILAVIKPATRQAELTPIVFSTSSSAVGLNFGSGSASSNIGYTWNNDSSSYDFNSSLAVPIGSWSFLAVSISSSQADLYVNLQKSTNFATHSSLTIEDIRIGNDNRQPQKYFNGDVSKVLIYDKYLNSNEVETIYKIIFKRMSLNLPAPTAHYSMDNADINGTTIYENLSSLNGTLINSPTTGASGIIGQSITFGATNKHISLPQDSLDFNAESFSFSLWTKVTSTIGFQRWIGQRGTGALGSFPGWYLQLDYLTSNDGRLDFLIETTDGFSDQTVRNQAWGGRDGNWHHLVGTFNTNTGTKTIYLDGVQWHQNTNANLIGKNLSSNRPSVIGIADNGGSFLRQFYGSIDEVYIWRGQVLSLEDVQLIYNRGLSGWKAI